MIFLDLFSGAGGFHLGLTHAGFKFKKVYFSEIDKWAIQVYKKHFKDAIYVGSVESIPEIERPNIITFGSPCQDFSLAGKRAGLEGQRSSLITYAIQLIDKYRPDVFILENVKGAFSTNDGADFWAIIKAFTDIGAYRLEWQLLNTAWFLPQYRERIYLVGHLGDGSGREVFPIGETGKVHSGNGNGIVNALDSNYHKGWLDHGQRTMVQYGNSQDTKLSPLDGNSQTLNSGHFNQPKILADSGKGRKRIRRLTPIECERLQGFEDNWTSSVSDTQRYKLMGNAVSVPVVAAIAERLKI